MLNSWQDMRMAARRLAGRPAYSALMILTLAIGIGANTAVFSVVDQTLLRPAPFAHADRLVDVLDWDRRSRGGGSDLTPPKILGWQAQPSVFEYFEAYAPSQFDVTGDAEPERVDGLIVSTGLLPMLGVQPRLGRTFSDDDGRPGSERVALISEDVWRRRFGAQPDVLGARIALNDEQYTIIGVMPRRFRLQGEKEAVWLPFNVKANETDTSVRGFYGLGRLAQGVAPETGQTLADAVGDRLQADTPLPRTWGLRLTRKKVAHVDATTRTALLVLLGAVGFVLLITCANVANLFLSHAAARQREMVIRSAIGASRARLIREVLTESVLLAVGGGALGVALAAWGVRALVAAAPANLAYQATSPIEIDGRILAVTAAITLLTGVVFGLVPALRGSRPNLEVTLRGSGTGATRGSFGRLPGGLVVAEVAFSLILLVGAALMIRTLVNLEAIEPGFEPRGLVAMHVDLPSDRYASLAARVAFFDAVREKLSSVPGVTEVTVAQGVPPGMGGFSFGTPQAEGSTVPVSTASVMVPLNTVMPEFFRTLRIPIVAGRAFTAADPEGTIVVSQAFADRFWPDGSALGRRFRMNSGRPWETIVGVAANVEGRAGERRTGLILYRPWVARAGAPAAAAANAPRRRSYDWRLLVVRAENPSAAVPLIKSAVWSVDGNQPIEKVALVEDMYAEAFARQRFVLLLMSAFAIIALALTAAGVFAVLSQVVVQRTREIGIRVALGATPSNVLRLILVRAVALTVIGTVLGLAGALGLSRFLEALLFEVRPADPVSFLSVTAILIVVALVACWRPTRAAMRVQPAVALRVQ